MIHLSSVEMKPVLMVEGEIVASGGAVTLGEEQQFVMEFVALGVRKIEL